MTTTNHRHERPRHGPYWGRPPARLIAFFRSRYLLPLVVALIQLGGSVHEQTHQPGAADVDAFGVALLVAGPAALTIRRRFPREVLTFVFVAALAYHWLDYPDGPVFLALIVAFVSALVHGHRVYAWGVLGLTYLSYFWLGYFIGVEPRPHLDQALGAAAWMLAAFAFFELGRGRRERMIEAARVRREESRRRASEERLRIARELHDVLGHNLSLINVQAGSALHVVDERPEQARVALTAIKDASNEALGDLRAVLDVLREGEEAPRTPTPVLADLDDLIERTRAAGIDVERKDIGSSRPLPPSIERAAYRIAQEALTNVARHAQATTARVAVEYREDALVIEVTDDGIGATHVDEGNGIAGMRERAAALGGELEAGPAPRRGFRIRAVIPVSREPA